MDMTQFFRLLSARKQLFWSIFGGFIAAAVILFLVMPRTYMSQVSVVIDSKTSDPITGMIMSETMMSANIATQIDVITSHNVALKVVDKLHLADSPQVHEDFQEETDGEGSIRDWLADKLLIRLDV